MTTYSKWIEESHDLEFLIKRICNAFEIQMLFKNALVTNERNRNNKTYKI